MAAVKRKRDPAFQANEKSLLLELVQEHWDTIECKKTDGLNKRAKAAVWEILSTKFNSTTSHIRRETVALRNLWENMKKGARGIITLRNLNRRTTGGGPPKQEKEDPIMDKLISLIAPTAQGLNNPYDDDAPIADASPLEPQILGTDSIADDSTLTIGGALDWSSCTPSMLRTPTSKVLKYQPIETLEVYAVEDLSTEQGEESCEHNISPQETPGIPVPSIEMTPSTSTFGANISTTDKHKKMLTSRRRPVLKQTNGDLLTKLKSKTLVSCNEQATLQHNITMEILNIQKKQELEKLKQEEIRTEILQITLQRLKKE